MGKSKDITEPKNVLGNDPFLQGAKPNLLFAPPKGAPKREREGSSPPTRETVTPSGPPILSSSEAKRNLGKSTLSEALERRFASLEAQLQSNLNRIEEKFEQKDRKNGSPLEELEKRLERLSEKYEERLKETIQQYQNKKEPTPEEEHRFRKEITQILLMAYQKAMGTLSLKQLWNFFQQISLKRRSEEVDEFGLDPIFEARMKPFFDFLYKTWWRVETTGVTHIPNEGRALLVANHSGALPYDGAMIKAAVLNEHPAHREVRPLIENFVYYFPFGGSFMSRVGGARACQENAQMLLERDQLVIVFPEGVKGVGKLYSKRYQLQRFGRGGFIKLALRTESLIVPVAVVGAEEAMPLIGRANWLGRIFKLPYVPITPTFPWLGLLGLIPYPTKWYIHFGKPFDFSSYGPEATEDDILVNQFSEMVRSNIQEMIYDQLKKRRSIWLG